MTRETESLIRGIFRDAIEKASDKIRESDNIALDFYWPDGYLERLAEMLTQAIALLDESADEARGH